LKHCDTMLYYGFLAVNKLIEGIVSGPYVGININGYADFVKDNPETMQCIQQLRIKHLRYTEWLGSPEAGLLSIMFYSAMSAYERNRNITIIQKKEVKIMEPIVVPEKSVKLSDQIPAATNARMDIPSPYDQKPVPPIGSNIKLKPVGKAERRPTYRE